MLRFYRRGRGQLSPEPIWPAATRSDLTLVPKPEHHPSPPKQPATGQHDILQQITEDLSVSTGADGAAIAIEQDGMIVCRASAGDCAPSVGAILNCDSGLSGLCLRSGEMLRCDDAAADLRVNAEVAGVLGILSVLAIPLRREDHTVGVVVVLSRAPNAFGRMEEEIANRTAATVLHSLAEKSAPGDVAGEESLRLIPECWETTAAAAALAQVGEIQERDAAAIEYTILEDSPDALPKMPARDRLSEPSAERQTGPSACAETPAVDISDPPRAPEATFAYASLRPSRVESIAVPELRSVLVGAAIFAILCAVGAGLWRLTNMGVAKQSAAAAQASSAAESSRTEELRRAALEGDAGAQYELAMRYLSGDGQAPSESEAIAWLLKSAHQGNSSAQYQLGLAYEHGTGVQQEYVKAYACYVMADINGNSDSQAAQRALAPKLADQEMAEVRTLVGQMYKNGIGTPANNVQAYVWFTLAEAAGSRQGQQEKALIASKMSSAVIAVANRRASEWLEQHSQAPR